MSPLPATLTHLALIIDLKEERLEKSPIPFIRTQIRAELDGLFRRFEAEYQEFLAATGQSHTAQMLR